MCWISIATQPVPVCERVDLYHVTLGRIPDCAIHAGDLFIICALSKTEKWKGKFRPDLYTHWRYPPAPPAKQE